jgi:negative regulator of sigma E activity
MLPEHLQELLTAAVDGELTSAERRLVDKLLRDSEDARAFHAGIVADAQRLRRLPRATPTDDLAASVMNQIDERCLMPTPLPMPRRTRFWEPQKLLPWISMATAACVIILVSVCGYVYVVVSKQALVKQDKNNSVEPPAVSETAKKSQRQQPKPQHANVQPSHGDAKAPDDVPEMVDPVVVKSDPPLPAEPEQLVTMPRPVVGVEKVVGTPSELEIEPFVRVNVRLSLLLPLKDLDQPYPRSQVRDELKKDEVIRLDLFCKDSTRAVEMLQAAFKARGQHLLVDALAQDRLKKKLKAEYAFYSESMTADEIVQLLESLGAEDKKLEARRAGDGAFDKFLLAPFVPSDLNELARLLGIPASKVNLPKAKPVGALDPRKSLESVTAAQLAMNLPKARGNEKLTLVLPYGAGNHFPQNSKEIKAFLDKRGERKPGQAPMMLVLRTIN